MNAAGSECMNAQDPAQLTVRAVILSLILAVLLAAANAYLGLFAGLTVATAIPAAVVSMGVLRLLGRSSILENNIVATGASAASSIAAGTIFTIPALVLMGHWTRFDYWWVLAIAGLGGLLGVMFSVPLRRTLILDQKLQFPEGVATAEVLKVGQDPGRGLKALSLAAGAGAFFKFALAGLKFSPESFAVARYFGERTIGFFGINLSPALLGVGFIVGFNIGCLMLSGGALSWWVFIPFYNNFMIDQNPELAAQLVGLSAGDAAGLLWSRQIRYIGVGAMLIGGLWSLWSLRKSLLSGIKTGMARKSGSSADVPHTERDLPMSAIMTGIVLFVLPLFALYYAVVDSFGIAFTMAVIMVIAGFVFSSVSGYMAGLVGSSNNPVSGITISTILFASLLLLAIMGKGSTVGPVAAIMIGAVTCCAAAVAGDNLQDLKAGQLVGATPWRQQVMLAIGAIASAAVMAPVLNLLLEAYGIGTPAREGVTAARGAAGDAHGFRRERHLRRRPAVEHGCDRRRRRRARDRARRVAQGPQRKLARARACRRGRNLPAARTLDANLLRRPDRRARDPLASQPQSRGRSGDPEADGPAVLRGTHCGRGHRRRPDRDPDRDY